MSRKSKRSKARLRALERDAWFALPREFSRYAGVLIGLSGLLLLVCGWRIVDTAQTDVQPLDSLGPMSYGAGGRTAPATGTVAQVSGGVDLFFGLAFVGLGISVLLVKRR